MADYNGIASGVLWYLEFFAFVIILILFFHFFLYIASLNYPTYNTRFDMKKNFNVKEKRGKVIQRFLYFNLMEMGSIQSTEEVLGRWNLVIAGISYLMTPQPAPESWTVEPKRVSENDTNYIRRCQDSCYGEKPVCYDPGCIWFCRLIGCILTIAVCYYFAYEFIAKSKLKFTMFVHM